ncbi:DUF1150 family protein [Acidocella aminolytica]|jgi:hypothetical protein|uniref:DUF1150 domain-containing protein n=1 Tax=Acidocella aminolytica 101 = DSM 11237 TaxID=1120923 RepID=A0A0D6PG88_9PROT|nr:DUF1150 family protein [Acidocella aminolytica]GAN80785.1 hypothetical protein Aam_060_011 [Acidocella aminolytica 101 = DSM 11237]GBQ36450.1 hypothetical protein AA11237_1249 [Acidocella aminolytica 101 = DSM 11237]SHE33540.1 Protein of unknown function [Acidocella aminolytica 101 = DSM 11237]
MNIKNHDGTANFVPGTVLDIHHISPAQLALLGLEEIAFVKPVMTDNGPAFAIHAADGTPMAIAANPELAAAAIIQHEMVPNLVH